MEIQEGPIVQEGSTEIVTPQEQSPATPQPAFQPSLPLDEATVRAAVMQAEASGEDPTRLKVGAVEQIQDPKQPPKAAQAETPVEVPEKFKKPNGEVDVEKLNASTKQLDEAIQTKQEKLQDVNKFVEEALKQFKEKERQLHSMPNPDRLAAQLPVQPAPQAPVAPNQYSDAQLEAMINADFQANPARTVAQLVQLALQRELQPITEERKDNQIRGNLKELVTKDPRVITNIGAINAKLQENPELWNLKNPHKAAWLEVKEDLRLGELSQAQTQPSKPVAPVLGGGTPPPAPSSSTGQVDVNTVLQASKQLAADPPNRNKYDQAQWEKMDQVARQLFK